MYLNDSLSIVSHLGVDDDLKFHSLGLHDAFESLEVDPQVVGVEDLEFTDWKTFDQRVDLFSISESTHLT